MINFRIPKNIWDLGGYLHILERTIYKICERTKYKILERMLINTLVFEKKVVAMLFLIF